VDIWIFQDSFEHIPDPAAFLAWMQHNSAPSSEILMVLPRADSLSRRLLGRLWPHKLPDHRFQWSRAGLVGFMARRGFELRADFFALKYVSPQMLIAHALHHAAVPPAARKWLGGAAFSFPFNFGEMALVFRRAGAG
ncbi:MAG TPA: methyltransferase domain-containing protein, partial [Gemmatimonadaceae bacterium]|nr:methyltransferase domain-containing protein [Gemmatimonadaceae bacterium]